MFDIFNGIDIRFQNAIIFFNQYKNQRMIENNFPQIKMLKKPGK